MQLKEYLNQQQNIKHQEEVIAKLKQFNREKSIKRAESREKMLNKIERVEKPIEVNNKMNIQLEPEVISGHDVFEHQGPHTIRVTAQNRLIPTYYLMILALR